MVGSIQIVPDEIAHAGLFGVRRYGSALNRYNLAWSTPPP
jgi:hypothetical protein